MGCGTTTEISHGRRPYPMSIVFKMYSFENQTSASLNRKVSGRRVCFLPPPNQSGMIEAERVWFPLPLLGVRGSALSSGWQDSQNGRNIGQVGLDQARSRQASLRFQERMGRWKVKLFVAHYSGNTRAVWPGRVGLCGKWVIRWSFARAYLYARATRCRSSLE
jgi:hypothetical protein